MAFDPGSAGLLKALVDIVRSQLPDPADKKRLRVMEKLLEQSVDRTTELEGVAELLGKVEKQRDALARECFALRIRIAELEQKPADDTDLRAGG